MGPQCVHSPCAHEPYYGLCNGELAGIPPSTPDGNTRDTAQIRGLFNIRGAKMRLADVKDGTTNTIMIGEVRPAESASIASSFGAFNAWREIPIPWTNLAYFWGPVAHTLSPINYRTDLQAGCSAQSDEDTKRRAWMNSHLSWGFKSRHPTGSNFLFADGSVHFLSEEMDHRVYQYLGCRNDLKVIDDW